MSVVRDAHSQIPWIEEEARAATMCLSSGQQIAESGWYAIDEHNNTTV